MFILTGSIIYYKQNMLSFAKYSSAYIITQHCAISALNAMISNLLDNASATKLNYEISNIGIKAQSKCIIDACSVYNEGYYTLTATATLLKKQKVLSIVKVNLQKLKIKNGKILNQGNLSFR